MTSGFTKNLLKWNSNSNFRDMPWKGEKDPYRIWLSEIILQQTRVEQGRAYYQKFITEFPTIQNLAAATEQKVFKLWEGLGYYTRCKNLIASAKFISEELGGRFPDTYEAIRALKGIGPYTAAAIASFAFDKPHAVVDGNVIRVLARFFGISTPVSNSEGKKLYSLLAEALLDKKQPAIYNQAIMDFGAVICKPQQPLCSSCVQQSQCEAFRHNCISRLPVKEKVLQKKLRWFYYFIIEHNNHIYIRKRSDKDIWQNLYEFVLKEHNGLLPQNEISFETELRTLLGEGQADIQQVSKVYKQQLSHQTIKGQFITVRIYSPALITGYEPVLREEVVKYPFPKIISAWLFSQSAV